MDVIAATEPAGQGKIVSIVRKIAPPVPVRAAKSMTRVDAMRIPVRRVSAPKNRFVVMFSGPRFAWTWPRKNVRRRVRVLEE